MGILEDILTRLERIEAAVGTGTQPAQTPAEHYAPAQQAPAPQPAPASRPAYGPLIMPPPAPSPAGPASTPGPQPVPTLEELRERLMTLNEQKGAELCISLLRNHQGQNEEGSVNVTFVPQEQYAALYGAINQQLGVH